MRSYIRESEWKGLESRAHYVCIFDNDRELPSMTKHTISCENEGGKSTMLEFVVEGLVLCL